MPSQDTVSGAAITQIYTCHEVLHSKLKEAINLANTSDFNEI